MGQKLIPIAKPYFGEEEATAAREAILSGWVTQGPRVEKFEENFADYVGAKYACAVSSCTTALHLALLSIGVGSGDVVITVSHSFIATANSVRHCGAEPVFVDIDPDTFNMSPLGLEKFLLKECVVRGGRLHYRKASGLAKGESPLVRRNIKKGNAIGGVAAIMPVHQMGMPCDMKAILSLAGRFKVPVVEDAACAIGSEISLDAEKHWERIGRPHGDIACFSFHPRKVIATGDGGMLVTNSATHDKRFRLLRQHGMSISDTARHVSSTVVFEKYMETGYNYRMTDIQAAVGIEQLKRMREIIKDRKRVAAQYKEALGAISWLKLPEEPFYCRTNWQSYPVRVLKSAPCRRDALMQYLLDRGVSTRRGIMNAHQERPYRNSHFDLKNSEIARDSVMLLPIFYDLDEADIKKIAKVIRSA
ncbi:MAG: DegT/DnrJ/EryC1/StrS family aminotransferase [Candidatus Omnitrophica bacterium]|nr:DegT/DnrJ/EryC1/StrS family aminotransferase [Candidatus Omnitrophota bacterium]MBU1808964.1 DegT/DnrJ/EryC1/StrS family aminotransferase [Candidatus Omnitrophota bacterium]